MRFQTQEIPGPVVVEPELHEDDRGFFFEFYHSERFERAGLPDRFVQDNHSGSRGGVLRGLHFQEPHAQGKLVRAVRGAVFDVAVDVRVGSPAYGRWTGVRLSPENRKLLWVPTGFAHGFVVLSEWAEVTYKCTEVYRPEAERVLAWDDPAVAVDWPVSTPVLSERDAAGHSLAELRGEGHLPAYTE